MSDFILKTARAVGLPTDTTWAQAHMFADIFFIIVLEKNQSTPSESGSTPSESGSSPDVNLAASGKQFFLHFEQVYQEEFDAKQGKKNLETFKLIVQKAMDGIPDSTIISFAAGVIGSTGLLYVAVKHAEVRIKRRSATKKILAGEELTFASGFLEEGDVVMLLSFDLANGLAKEAGEIFASDDPDEIAEAMSASMHKATSQEKQVALLAKAKRTLPSIIVGEEGVERTLKIPSTLKIFFGNAVGGKVQRVGITVFLLLTTLFILSLFLGVNKRQQEQAKERFAQAYSLASQKYDEGMALSDLNPTLAQKTFREAKDMLEDKIGSFKEKSEEQEKLLELRKKIDEGLRSALRITTLTDVPIFFDLNLVKEGATGVSMSMYEEKILALDTQNGAAYTLTLENKKAELVTGAIAGAKKEAIGAEYAYVWSDSGIEKVSLVTKKRSLAVEKDDVWGELGEIVSFAGNLYVLDKTNGSIYKYQGSGDTFSERRNYLAADIKPDFGDSMAMSIDGAIWVLFSDGRISKFAGGAPQSFSIDGMDIALSDPRGLFTDDESEHLYILDRGNQRVVVVKKDGTYTSQYEWEGLKDATDIAASEKQGKILLLSGSKIYGVDIKN